MEMPLDDYRFEPNFRDKKVKRDFLSLLPEGEELLWVGKMKRDRSYWFSKGLLALGAVLISLFINFVLLFYGYGGFVEGEFAGKYHRVFTAMGAALLPWIASYFLCFQHLIYDAQTRYAFSSKHLLLYRPIPKKQPYQWQGLLALGELKYQSNRDKTGTISCTLEIPHYESGEIGLIFLPLFEFIENGEVIFRQLISLQEDLQQKENVAGQDAEL